ncbi:tetratricopeptide repeat protein [Treponema sp.]|uniref:tetratricopeptide repeat protein n=1 Tax=Treponema sp. TaxID=166 RepID=UPI0025FC3BB1|nr:tetratricopeptide repeat protein [Treponema sp.]MCR5219348.1 hypothetical protein [Treponema sp.]
MKFDKERAAFLALCTCTAVFTLSCGTTSNVTPEPQAIAIPDKFKDKRTFFSSIDDKIMSNAQIGSPSSIKQAVSQLHKSLESDYLDNEKILIGICTNIMQIVWPSENITWEIPAYSDQNTYIGTIETAKRGIYDSGHNSGDFFSNVLPSLVLVTSETRNDYYQQSRQALNAALEQDSNSILVRYLLGILELRENNPKAAIEYLTQARKGAPSNFEIQFALLKANYMAHNYEHALTLGESLLEQYPQNVDVLALCSRSSYAMNDLTKAESYVVRVLLLEPENLEYVLLRARILMDKNDFIRASSLLDLYSTNNTSGREYLLLKAKLQREWNKNYTAAGETIGKALTLYPDDNEVLLCAAQISSAANTAINGMTAKQFTDKILESDPDNIEALLIYIDEMTRQKKWTEAYAVSSKLIAKENPADSWFYRHIDICLALKKNTEASNLANKMYSANNNDEEAQKAYIKVLIQTYQKTNALQLINKLLPLSNAKMKSFLYYQRSYTHTNEEEILNDLRSSLTSNPRNKDSLYRLYEIYYSKKDYRRAQYYLKQVVALDSTNSELLQKNNELDSLLKK